MMGEPFEETFTVKNDSGLRLPYCEVRDARSSPDMHPGSVSLGAGWAVTRRRVQPPWHASLRPVEARLGDLFRLLPASIRVAPRTLSPSSTL